MSQAWRKGAESLCLQSLLCFLKSVTHLLPKHQKCQSRGATHLLGVLVGGAREAPSQAQLPSLPPPAHPPTTFIKPGPCMVPWLRKPSPQSCRALPAVAKLHRQAPHPGQAAMGLPTALDTWSMDIAHPTLATSPLPSTRSLSVFREGVNQGPGGRSGLPTAQQGD